MAMITSCPCSKVAVWLVLILLLIFINASNTIAFSTNFLFINNSVTLDKLGSMNGVSMVMSSVARWARG